MLQNGITTKSIAKSLVVMQLAAVLNLRLQFCGFCAPTNKSTFYQKQVNFKYLQVRKQRINTVTLI
jgi:hypothetical protein